MSENKQENFRDTIGTIKEDGNRNFLHPKKPKGIFYKYRSLLSYLLLAFFISAPFILINGNQFLMFNVLKGKYNIFGQPFWPQDFYLLVLSMLIGVVFVILFTVIFGRIFCGWICPQTIFLEMVFRKIEYMIEGDRSKQIKLEKQDWNSEKIFKKGIKWLIFYAISFGIANVFVAYNYKRGENDNGRSKFRKNEDRTENGFGDCIDCKQCVQVCPTGIDIRNGTQLECVNCTACIDACDAMMDNVGFERGLISYASENNIAKGEKFHFNIRIKSYVVVLSLMVIGLVTLLFLRSDIEATILKLPGQMYTTTKTKVTNVYTFTLVNKTVNDFNNLKIKLIGKEGVIKVVGNKISLDKESLKVGTIFITIDKATIESSKEKLKIGIYKGGKLIETTSTNFTSPLKIN